MELIGESNPELSEDRSSGELEATIPGMITGGL
jgi:hypothetical protein